MQKSPKCKKRVSYHPNRKGPMAGQVAAQCITSPENSPKAIAMSRALKGVKTLPAVASSETVPLPAIPALTGVPGMPENLMSTGEDPEKLPDLGLTLASDNDGIIDTENRNITNIKLRETFNVEPLSTEEMDIVDALLSLQDLRDDSVVVGIYL